MLLTIFVFLTGCVIGRLRGGSLSGLISARFNRPGLLVFGITTVLVLNLIGPAFPLLWAILGSLAFFWFGLRNLHITGMIVLMIGMLLNLAPVLANGAMPVSDLALVSVGDVSESGAANISGLRESTDTATSLSAFGDVIPVPIFNTVVSLGDIIILVALADIAANLFLKSRRREELDDAGVSFAGATPPADNDRVEIVSPLATGNRPAHAAHRRPRRKAAPSTHVPAHALESSIDLTSPDAVIVLDGPDAYLEQPPPPSGSTYTPAHAPDTAIDDAPAFEELVHATIEETPPPPKTEIILPEDQVITLTDDSVEQESDQEEASELVLDDSQADEPALEVASPEPETSQVETSSVSLDKNKVDRRPIIDLTVSPTDDQLKEFLRRRAEADREFAERTTPGPRRRRGRSPRANEKVAEVSR